MFCVQELLKRTRLRASFSQRASPLYARELVSELQTTFLLALARCFFQYALQSTPVGANYYRLLAPIDLQNFTRALERAKIMFLRSYDLKKRCLKKVKCISHYYLFVKFIVSSLEATGSSYMVY